MIFHTIIKYQNARKRVMYKAWIFIIVLFIPSVNIKAQYFGRNKPSYKNFDFKVYETPNFEIYHYFDNDSLLDQLARTCEEWYKLHMRIFNDSLKDRNPIIFYKNHADFQQTTAITGEIGVGTGGVTEALKNRVIMPIALTNSQTDHVLGHELVHAFQYNAIIRGDSTNINSLRNLPLWMIEGMAEYLSIGSVDEHTAMWMRDAILNDDFPTLKEMTRNQKYFPYRYGQAFWAFVAKTWGDAIIIPLFVETARFGYEEAIKHKIGLTAETFSGIWKSAMERYYTGIMTDTIDNPTGKKILYSGNAGNMNLSPSISPDGKYIVFLSERDMLSLDLFLSDADNGNIIKKLSSTIHRNEIDALNYLESAGTWSPDSKEFAFSVFEKGKNKLLIMNIEKGRLVEEYNIPGVPAFSNPVWSPDGESIIVAGLVEGINNLYRFYPVENRVDQITNDRYSYIQPSFSPNGKYLVFATDKEPDNSEVPNMNFNLGIIDLESNSIRIIPVFDGADNLNPLFSSNGESVYFLSNRDGFRNLYRFHLKTGKTYQMTKYMTGISGITHFSPAISVARSRDIISYSYYYGGKYSIFRANAADFAEFEVSSDSLNFQAAILPPAEPINPNLVDKKLHNRESYEDMEKEKYSAEVYKPKFKLDYISNISAGVSTNRFSTGMAGSVFAIFSDIVGKNQLYTTLAVNGEIYDFGGQFAYMNQAKRLNWGASISHIPYQYATAYLTVDTLSYGEELVIVDDLVMDQMRIFEDQISVFAYLPFSTTRRVEFGVSQSWYYYRIDRWHSYYDPFGGLIGQSREKMDAPDGFNVRKLDAAFVTDNSIFGYASPLQGSRSRFQIEKYFGEINFLTALVDYRKYFRMRPFTLATRFFHYGRYGSNADSRILSPLYLGYPWYVRGYDNNKIYEMMDYTEVQKAINQLYGDKITVANLELRFPLSGPERLSLIKSKLLFTELCLFLDAGLAWYDFDDISFVYKANGPDLRMPVYSAGASLRVNIFGAIILEPYYAFPFQSNGINGGVLGLNFIPGW